MSNEANPELPKLFADPRYGKLPLEDRRSAVGTLEPDFHNLSPEDQDTFLTSMERKFVPGRAKADAAFDMMASGGVKRTGEFFAKQRVPELGRSAAPLTPSDSQPPPTRLPNASINTEELDPRTGQPLRGAGMIDLKRSGKLFPGTQQQYAQDVKNRAELATPQAPSNVPDAAAAQQERDARVNDMAKKLAARDDVLATLPSPDYDPWTAFRRTVDNYMRTPRQPDEPTINFADMLPSREEADNITNQGAKIALESTRALADLASGLTSLDNVMIGAGTGGTAAVAQYAGPMAQLALRAGGAGLSAYFASDLGQSALEHLPEAKKAVDAGDLPTAAYHIAYGAGAATLAGLAAGHTFSEAAKLPGKARATIREMKPGGLYGKPIEVSGDVLPADYGQVKRPGKLGPGAEPLDVTAEAVPPAALPPASETVAERPVLAQDAPGTIPASVGGPKSPEAQGAPEAPPADAIQARPGPRENAAELESYAEDLPPHQQRPWANTVQSWGRWAQKYTEALDQNKPGTAKLAATMVDKHAKGILAGLNGSTPFPTTAEELRADWEERRNGAQGATETNQAVTETSGPVTGTIPQPAGPQREQVATLPQQDGPDDHVFLQDFVANRGGFADQAHMVLRSKRPVSSEELKAQFFPDLNVGVTKLRADDFMGAVQPGRQPFTIQFFDKNYRAISAPDGIEQRLGLQAGENYHAGAPGPGGEQAVAEKPAKAPELPPARPPIHEPVYGRDIEIAVPGEETRYPARFAVYDAGDIHPSHNAVTFDENPEYDYRNERNYRDSANAQRVLENSNPQKFDNRFVLTDSPTAEHGGPVLDSRERRNVLGGNNRILTQQRLYAQNPEEADRLLRQPLIERAAEFGLDPAQLARIPHPILSRERTSRVGDAQVEIGDYNKKAAAELTPHERAVADGRRMSTASIERIAANIGDAGEEGSLADALRGDNGSDVLDSLLNDGVVTTGEKNAYLDEKGNLTTEARGRVAKALVGRLFETPQQFAATPPEMRAKLERVAPQVLRVEGRPEWNITPHVREALALIEYAREHGGKNLDDMVNQPALDARETRTFSPEALAIGKTLQKGPIKAAGAFRRYANDEVMSRPGAQTPLFEPPSRQQAFADAFGMHGPVRSLDRIPPELADAYYAPTDSDTRLAETARAVIASKRTNTEPPIFVANLPAVDLIYRLSSGIATDAGRAGGYFLEPFQIEAAFARGKNLLRRLAPKETKANIARVLADVENIRVAAQGGPAIVLRDHPRLPDGIFHKALQEELDHFKQWSLTASFPGHLGGHENDLLFSPEGTIAEQNLSQYHESVPSGNAGSVTMGVEVGARLMRAGRYTELGLSGQQARILAARYALLLRKVHGHSKPSGIIHQIGEALRSAKTADEVGPPARGQEPLPPAGGAGPGRGTLPGGTGPALSRDKTGPPLRDRGGNDPTRQDGAADAGVPASSDRRRRPSEEVQRRGSEVRLGRDLPPAREEPSGGQGLTGRRVSRGISYGPTRPDAGSQPGQAGPPGGRGSKEALSYAIHSSGRTAAQDHRGRYPDAGGGTSDDGPLGAGQRRTGHGSLQAGVRQDVPAERPPGVRQGSGGSVAEGGAHGASQSDSGAVSGRDDQETVPSGARSGLDSRSGLAASRRGDEGFRDAAGDGPLLGPERPSLGGPRVSASERGSIRLGSGAEELANQIAPPLKAAADAIVESARQIRTTLAPTVADANAQRGSLPFRRELAEMARRYDQTDHSLRTVRRFFKGQPREAVVDFIQRLEDGQPQPSKELDQIAGVFRAMLDGRRGDVQDLGTGKLQGFYENYFPHIWKRPEKAGDVFRTFFAKRPFEGPKSFLKKRKYPTFKDGIDAGLEPVSWNPVDLVLLKTREMDRYVMAHRTLAAWKEMGLAKFVDARSRGPVGAEKIADPVGTVYGASVQNIPEYPNAGLYEPLNKLAADLGLNHERTFKLGGPALGYAHHGGLRDGDLETRHGTAEDVLAHEIGHHLDWKYDLADKFVNFPAGPVAENIKRAYAVLRDKSATPATRNAARKTLRDLRPQVERRKAIKDELRALADLRGGRKDYIHKREEKMAAIVQAWVGARKKFERVAPTVFDEWTRFLDAHPELKPLRDIEGSMKTTELAQPYDVGGLVIKGHWWAPTGTARLLNNYLSPGLRSKSGVYRSLLGLNNVMNQFQLGWSAFHLGFTSMDAAVSRLALAYEMALRGRPVGAIKVMARVPVAPITNVMAGNKLLKAWYDPSQAEGDLAKIANALTLAGGRVRMDEMYQTKIAQQMMDALSGSWAALKRREPGRAAVLGGKAALLSPFAATETAVKPILEWLVPRQKLGVFLDKARFDLERLGPDASPEDVQTVLARAWDSVDNRMGQLVYDNLFWNRTLKDLLMLTVRSVGWNLGTVRELGGGLYDAAAEPIKLFRAEAHAGDGPTPFEKMNLNRITYWMALVTVTAVSSAIYQYLHTGKGPEQLEDYFFPKNGEVDEQGRPMRMSLPSYLKDVYHLTTEPGKTVANKMGPLASTFAEMIRNKDYYGTRIRNPEAPVTEQIGELATDFAKKFEPMAVRNVERAKEKGGSAATKAEGFVGIVPAPASLNQTPAERLAYDYLAARRPDAPRTQEEADRTKLLAGMRRSMHKDGTVGAEGTKALQEGKITRRQMETAFRESRLSPLERAVNRLPIEQALNVWDRANAAQRKTLLPMLMGKADRAWEGMTEEQRQTLRPRILAVQKAAAAGN